MKSILRLPLAALLLALFFGLAAQEALADGCQSCVANMSLPPAPGIGVTLLENTAANAASYITANLINIPAGYAIHSGLYPAWCVDLPTANLTTTGHRVLPMSTYSGSLLIVSANWPKVNYLLNHKAPGATAHDVQRAIWILLGQTPPAGFVADTTLSDAMVADANANGATFIPVGPQVMGVVLSEGGPGGQQDTMIEVPAPTCGTIGDWVFQDTNRDGLQNSGDIGINGVTVKLTDALGNVLATTVTANAPAGYTGGVPPGTPGYYQFTGLCAGQYKVVIDDTQPALAGYTPTTPLVGNGSNAATDSNHSTGDLITLPTDTTVDETYDFGYVTPLPLTVVCAPNTGMINTPYSYPISATGGTGGFTFTLKTGQLPAGLNLDSATGIISGTPTAAGSSSFSIEVKDSSGQPAGTTTTNCTIVIQQPVTVQCASGITGGQQGNPFTAQIHATGGTGTYTSFQITLGHLPAGLTLDASTGAISGTPTENGTFSYTVQVTDSNGNTGMSSGCTLVITPPQNNQVPITVNCAPGTTGQVGVQFSSAAVASGGSGSFIYSIVGVLPPGLNINPSTGLISGMPTSFGSYSFTVKATDSADASATATSSNCTIAIAPPPLSVICAPGTTGQNGVMFSSAAVASGGTGSYIYSIVGTLPAGLSINPSTGLISGTPTSFGASSFTVKVTDANNASATATSSNCTITIAPPPLSVICAPGTTGQNGVMFSSAAVASGGTGSYIYSIVGTLPAGLSINPSTGLISGTPTSFGASSFTVKVTDANDASATATSSNCTIMIAPPPLSVICAPGTTGQNGVMFSSAAVASGGTGSYIYSIVGTLPAGLSINPSTGLISGTPTAFGASSFTVKVTDANDASATATSSNCTITIAPPPLSVICAPGTTGQNGVMFSSAAVASGGTGSYIYSIVGTLPAGLSINPSTGLISGTPTAFGASSFTVKVTDANNASATATSSNCTITIAPPPLSVICAPGTTGQNGVMFSSAAVASGGTGSYIYSIVGSLPAGLTINPSTGLISGTPTAFGASSFTVKVTDANNASATATSSNCTITIAPPPLSVICAPGTTGQQGVAYSSSAKASGGTGSYIYSIVGTLPAGLSINSSTGLISGTPTAAGTSSFTVKVTDANNASATATSSQCTITIAPPALSVLCAPITGGQQGVPYSSAAVASGGTGGYTYSIVGGALPAGVTLNASTGAISGTPTVFGVFSYKIQVKDSSGAIATSGTTSCTLTIVPTPPNLYCGTCSSSKGTVGVSYTSKLSVTGGSGTGYVYTLDAGSALPPGLTLNASTGVISGVPTTPGTYIVTSIVTDSMGGTDSATCTIIVSGPPLNLDCGTCGSNRATIGTPYSSSLTATGGKPGYTYSISYGSLPAGLTLNPVSGAITGTPTATGTFTFTSKVVDANGIVDTARCTIYVAPSPVTLDCGLCGSAHLTLGTAFSSKLSISGGRASYTYSIVSGSLPTGLTLSSTTGTISGTPTAAGTFTFTAKVVDADGNTDTATCTITVAGAPVNLDCGICGSSSAKVGTYFSATYAISGGKAPYVYAVTTGALPPGLSISSSTGGITGTPTTAGTYTFTTTVTDANGSKDTATCTIVVNGSSINLDCGACKSGKATLGVAYSNTLSVTGASGSVTFSIISGSLPTGLHLNTSTGAITGTPTASGTFTFTSQVRDAYGRTDTDICTITVAAVPLDIQCGGCSGGNGTVGSAYSATFSVTGGVAGFTFSIVSGSLPAGLTLNASTGVVSGTPTTAGTYYFTAKVTDSKGTTDTVSCTIAVVSNPLDIQCGACGTSRIYVGTSYSATLTASGGTAPYTFSIYSGSLPAGLTLTASTGVISGNPTTPGTYTFTSKVTDKNGKTDTVTCTITVVASPVNLDCGTCGANKAQVGVYYSSNLKPTGGIGSFTFSIVSGSLPSGLSLNPSTGAISGTPTADGTFTFTSKATDSKGSYDTAVCSIVVNGNIKAGDYVTYTQGGWGASPSGNNPGTLLKNNFFKVYGSAGISIGGSRKLTFTSASAITAFLPQGGTAGVLAYSATNPTSSNGGVFAGQVLALQLSVDFSNNGITPGGLASLKLDSGPLNGQTVAQVLALANAVLGGNTSALPYGLTVSGLNDILDTINNNFDGGSTNGGCAH